MDSPTWKARWTVPERQFIQQKMQKNGTDRVERQSVPLPSGPGCKKGNFAFAGFLREEQGLAVGKTQDDLCLTRRFQIVVPPYDAFGEFGFQAA